MPADDRAPPGLSRGAYLVVEFDVRGPVPVFRRLFFASAPGNQLTHHLARTILLTIADEPEVDGVWYGEAEKKLRERIATSAFYAWCRPHLPPEREPDETLEVKGG